MSDQKTRHQKLNSYFVQVMNIGLGLHLDNAMVSA